MISAGRWLPLMVLLMLSGCALQQQHTADTEAPRGGYEPTASQETEAEAMAQALPHQVGGYQFAGGQLYPPGLGYSLRYVSVAEPSHHADFYVWPVPAQAAELPESAIVDAAFSAAVDDIHQVDAYGQIRAGEKQLIEEQPLLVGQHFDLVAGNLAMRSLLYVSIAGDRLLKARISMPDNPANRERNDTDATVQSLFEIMRRELARR